MVTRYFYVAGTLFSIELLISNCFHSDLKIEEPGAKLVVMIVHSIHSQGEDRLGMTGVQLGKNAPTNVQIPEMITVTDVGVTLDKLRGAHERPMTGHKGHLHHKEGVVTAVCLLVVILIEGTDIKKII